MGEQYAKDFKEITCTDVKTESETGNFFDQLNGHPFLTENC